MYSLLIVDDEDLELQALKTYVPWQSIGITDVVTACNGQDALEVCYKKNIDIIITDIKMPILDGIELARELSKINYKAKVIFLSGYDDFNFVHDAYKAGGVEYILKPFSKEEVIKVVKEAQHQLENKQTFDEIRRIYVEDQLGKLVFNKDSTVINELTKYGDVLKNNNLYFFSIHTNAPHDLLKKAMQPLYRYCLLAHNKNDIIIIYNNFSRLPNIISRIKDILLSENGIWCYFLYLEENIELLNISKKFEELEGYRQYLFYLSNEYIINASKFVKYEFSCIEPDSFKNILTFEYRHEIDMLENQITFYLQDVIDQKTKPKIVIENMIDICLHVMKKYFKEGTDVSKKDILDQVMSSNNIEDLKNIMNVLIDKVKIKFSKGEDKNDKLIGNVIRYIENNYESPLTIEILSEIVYLSPNYLRAIFKEKTGATVHEFITNYRMEKATELLKSKKHKVKEISKMVGYDSESYFCATFYKIFQTTPNEYKKRHWS